MSPRLTLLIVAVSTLAIAAIEPAKPPADPHAVVRGMTISCQTWGREWGTDEMVRAMEDLKALGVNWIAIHPYAGIRADGTVVMSPRRYEHATWLTRPIREAHRLGLKIMIVPHLAYWGTKFSWRGEIRFESDEDWRRFFNTYAQWLVALADTCRDADALCLGSEIDGTLEHEQDWRTMIALVRERTKAVLTYAANWTDYERVPFWDALDAIGVDSYFPLTQRPGLPDGAELDAAWAQLIARLDAFADRFDRTLVLGELGYNQSSEAALRPWDYHQGGPDAEETQRRCLDAALKALKTSRRVAGAFLWKWFPGNTRHENFLLSTPAMRAVIQSHWAQADQCAAAD